MLTSFYVTFATVCFTLLGLWLIVVQTRHAEWRAVAMYRRRAFGVALHFSLPGVMSLLSLVDPNSKGLWRVTFTVIAAGGAMVLILLRGSLPGWVGRAAYFGAVAFYILVAIVAAVPSAIAAVGVSVLPVRIEAVLLTILVFVGINVAWLLLFDQTPVSRDPSRPRQPSPEMTHNPHLAASPRPWVWQCRQY